MKNETFAAESCLLSSRIEVLTEQVDYCQPCLADSSAANPTILVVDMQPEILRYVSVSLIESVAFEIRQACNNNYSLLFLESEDDSQTFAGLLNIPAEPAVSGRFVQVSKYGSNGSSEVIDAYHSNGLGQEHFLVCGVFGNSCVFETVAGLARSLPHARIDVVESACDRSIVQVLAKLESMANVYLV